MKRFVSKLAYLKVKDIIAFFQLLVSIPIAGLFKINLLSKKREIWLICEKRDEARDNGFALYKFIRENHPEINVYYAINKKSIDYKKIAQYGNIIEYGSVMHWIYYLVASKNISPHKDGKPNAAICYFIEVYGIWKNKRVFLQHGVTLNDSEWIYYKNTKMRLFICGAYPEYQFVRDNFGYPEEYVQYLGFSRFDALHNIQPNPKQIVLMPTWRNWLGLETTKSYKFDDISDFKNTEYFQKYNELINDTKIMSFLEKNEITMYFFPHRNMQKFIDEFSTKSKFIVIAKHEEYDIQDMLKNSALMITDYSSVSIDFAYMKKPIIYYQFDKEKFRKGHLGKGFFDYENDGFGPVCEEIDEVYKEITKAFIEGFKLSDSYVNKHSVFFKIYDDNNSKRIYEAIKKI